VIDGSGVLIVVFGCILGIALLLVNVVFVPQIVRSRWYRASIASISVALTSAVIVIGAAMAYVTLEREAIPVVEDIGVGIVVLGAGSILTSLVCLVGGLIAGARVSKPRF
jgi:hypothetical protein